MKQWHIILVALLIAAALLLAACQQQHVAQQKQPSVVESSQACGNAEARVVLISTADLSWVDRDHFIDWLNDTGRMN